MRIVLTLAIFAASLALADDHIYEEARDLSLEAADVMTLDVEAGAGSLEIIGEDGAGEITVAALIHVPERDDDRARQIIESSLVLTLEQDGSNAVLKGYFEGSSWGMSDSPGVRLEILAPSRLALKVEDRSGSMVIENIRGDIEVDDGSGSIRMSRVGGNVTIDDGSGSLTATDVGANIDIRDGSGSITVERVGGSVTVDDGSGSINVRDVQQDLIIESDGSGGLDFSGIQGRVEKND